MPLLVVQAPACCLLDLTRTTAVRMCASLTLNREPADGDQRRASHHHQLLARLHAKAAERSQWPEPRDLAAYRQLGGYQPLPELTNWSTRSSPAGSSAEAGPASRSR